MMIAAYDAAQAGASGARSVLLRGMAPMVRDGASQVWIDVAFEGTWRGHAAGEFTFSREVFSQIVANFERNPNPVPLDYEHATEVAIPAPAAGWVQGVEIRDVDGVAHLFALVEFTDEAAQWIREGRYRFSSAVVDFAARDLATAEEIGAEMLSLALTNVPFIRGQNPIRLSRRSSPIAMRNPMKIDKAEFIRRVRKLEGNDVTVEQLSKLAQSMGLLDEAMTGGGSGDAPADEPEGEGEPAAMSAALSADAPPAEPVAAAADAPPAEPPAEPGPEAEASTLLEQAMEATGLDLAGLVEALKSIMAGEPAAAVAPLSSREHREFAATKKSLAAAEAKASALEAEVATLKTTAKLTNDKIDALTKKHETACTELNVFKEREADELADGLVASGHILDDARDTWRKLALSDREQFDALAPGLSQKVPVGQHASGQTPPTEETPAINEDDPWVKERRRQLSATWLGRDAKALDNAIRRELAARSKNNGVRV